MAETERMVVVPLSDWAFRQLGTAARRAGRSLEEEAAGRLERSVQNRRTSDQMEEFLRIAREPSAELAGGSAIP